MSDFSPFCRERMGVCGTSGGREVFPAEELWGFGSEDYGVYAIAVEAEVEGWGGGCPEEVVAWERWWWGD